MSKLEKDYQRDLIKFLELKGHYVVKVIQATKAGVPDVLACIYGIFFGIECKTPKTKNNVSELQKHNLTKIKETGGIAVVYYGQDLETFYKELIDETIKASD